MATSCKIEPMLSTPLLASERDIEGMSTCQVDIIRMDSGQATSTSIQQQYVGTASGLSEMAQGGVGEVSIKMLMSSKGGMTIKAFRETSGAKINISNSTSSERLVQINGTKETIAKAFAAIGKKIELDAIVAKQTAIAEGQVEADSAASGPTHISFKLVIQSSQCGSIIGKGGSKIKEIREGTGTTIQVAGETLPNSTERAVTITGTPESLTLCINQISSIMLENPARGPHIPYKPFAVPSQPYQQRTNPSPYQAPYAATFPTTPGPATTTQQMRIPNNLIGCVIGRKGSKIHEIRVSSGAQIKIAGNEGGESDRLVTITGTPEAVGVAQYLISSRIHSEVNTFMTVGGATGGGPGAGGATNLP